MSKKRARSEHWKLEPEEHDFPAAETYLSLLLPDAVAARGRRGAARRRDGLAQGEGPDAGEPATAPAEERPACRARSEEGRCAESCSRRCCWCAATATTHAARRRRRVSPDLRELPPRRGRRHPLPARRAAGEDDSAPRMRPDRSRSARSSARGCSRSSSRSCWTSTSLGLEWRRLFAEVFGTFLLVLAGAGGAVVGAVSHGEISRPAAVAAPGLMVMAIILFMGAVSGAHLNPAVTLAFSLRGDFPWRRVPGYMLAQLAGAALACLFLWARLRQGRLARRDRAGPGIARLAGVR